MIDTATIKQAAIDSDETGFASVLTNNDTVIALCDEIERLTACLKKANDQAEHFEREWYLRGDEIERLREPPSESGICQTCGSACNERDELIKAEREIERLRQQLTIYEKHGVTCQTFGHKLTGCAECNRDDAAESVNETNAVLANNYLALVPEIERQQFHISTLETDNAGVER